MSHLKVKYAGLELNNPIIIGASNIVLDVENLKRLETAGAGAIVYKSLFEEQIQLEQYHFDNLKGEYVDRNSEMTNLFPSMEDAGPVEFLYKLEKARQAVKLPLIASLNAVYKDSWVDYAKKIAETGVDALELNFYNIPKDFNVESNEIENYQIDILKTIIVGSKLPVTVKLSPFYTNPLNIIKKIDEAGAKGVVLFNKLFHPDIDITNKSQVFPYNLSSESDNRLPLQYSGLLYGNIKAGICASSGISSGSDVVKMILAGADSVQVVSAIYRNKPEYIKQMLSDISKWMSENDYKSIDDFKGKLSRKQLKDDPFAYRRAQYVDILFNSESIFKQYPMV